MQRTSSAKRTSTGVASDVIAFMRSERLCYYKGSLLVEGDQMGPSSKPEPRQRPAEGKLTRPGPLAGRGAPSTEPAATRHRIVAIRRRTMWTTAVGWSPSPYRRNWFWALGEEVEARPLPRHQARARPIPSAIRAAATSRTPPSASTLRAAATMTPSLLPPGPTGSVGSFPPMSSWFTRWSTATSSFGTDPGQAKGIWPPLRMWPGATAATCSWWRGRPLECGWPRQPGTSVCCAGWSIPPT